MIDFSQFTLIKNPFPIYKNYNCFGCSPDNPFGLKLQFYYFDEKVYSRLKLHPNYQSYNGIIHGGILSTALDEIGTWPIYIKYKEFCFTTKLEVKFKKSVPLELGEVFLMAEIINRRRNIVFVESKIFDKNEVIYNIAKAQYFIVPDDIAKEKYKFSIKELDFGING